MIQMLWWIRPVKKCVTAWTMIAMVKSMKALHWGLFTMMPMVMDLEMWVRCILAVRPPLLLRMVKTVMTETQTLCSVKIVPWFWPMVCRQVTAFTKWTLPNWMILLRFIVTWPLKVGDGRWPADKYLQNSLPSRIRISILRAGWIQAVRFDMETIRFNDFLRPWHGELSVPILVMPFMITRGLSQPVWLTGFNWLDRMVRTIYRWIQIVELPIRTPTSIILFLHIHKAIVLMVLVKTTRGNIVRFAWGPVHGNRFKMVVQHLVMLVR